MYKKLVLFNILCIVCLCIISSYILLTFNPNGNLKEVTLSDLNSSVFSITPMSTKQVLITSAKTRIETKVIEAPEGGHKQIFRPQLGNGEINLLLIKRGGLFKKIPRCSLTWHYSTKESKIFSNPGIADFDRDGSKDFVIVSEKKPSEDEIKTSAELLLFLGKEGGYNKEIIGNFENLFVYTVHTADFNKDGIDDFVLAGFDAKEKQGRIIIFLNKKEEYVKIWEYSDKSEITDICAIDINKDGWTDLVFSGFSKEYNVTGFVSAFLNDGNLNFTKLWEKKIRKNPIFRLELITRKNSNSMIFTGLQSKMYLLILDEKGEVKKEVSYDLPSKSTALKIGDFDGDETEEVCVGVFTKELGKLKPLIILFEYESDCLKKVLDCAKLEDCIIFSLAPTYTDSKGKKEFLVGTCKNLLLLYT